MPAFLAENMLTALVALFCLSGGAGVVWFFVRNAKQAGYNRAKSEGYEALRDSHRAYEKQRRKNARELTAAVRAERERLRRARRKK